MDVIEQMRGLRMQAEMRQIEATQREELVNRVNSLVNDLVNGEYWDVSVDASGDPLDRLSIDIAFPSAVAAQINDAAKVPDRTPAAAAVPSDPDEAAFTHHFGSIPVAAEPPAPIQQVERTAPTPAPAPVPDPMADLIPAADPYTADEEALILKMYDEGFGNADIAVKLRRRSQGFHHKVTRLVNMRDEQHTPPSGVDPKIWDRLNAVGNNKLWTRAADLEMVGLFQSGMKLGAVAAVMEMDVEDVSSRYQSLCPNRNLIGAVDALAIALKARAEIRPAA